jgi:hypothetical protein
VDPVHEVREVVLERTRQVRRRRVEVVQVGRAVGRDGVDLLLVPLAPRLRREADERGRAAGGDARPVDRDRGPDHGQQPRQEGIAGCAVLGLGLERDAGAGLVERLAVIVRPAADQDDRAGGERQAGQVVGDPGLARPRRVVRDADSAAADVAGEVAEGRAADPEVHVLHVEPLGQRQRPLERAVVHGRAGIEARLVRPDRVAGQDELGPCGRLRRRVDPGPAPGVDAVDRAGAEPVVGRCHVRATEAVRVRAGQAGGEREPPPVAGVGHGDRRPDRAVGDQGKLRLAVAVGPEGDLRDVRGEAELARHQVIDVRAVGTQGIGADLDRGIHRIRDRPGDIPRLQPDVIEDAGPPERVRPGGVRDVLSITGLRRVGAARRRQTGDGERRVRGAVHVEQARRAPRADRHRVRGVGQAGEDHPRGHGRVRDQRRLGPGPAVDRDLEVAHPPGRVAGD